MDGCVTRFGQVEFDAARGRLSVAGSRVELDRSCVAILSMLLSEAGKDVDKDRLLAAGWPGRVVHENSLAKAIGRLRQALGENGKMLETVHGYGYRLAAADPEGEADPAERIEIPVRAHWFGRPGLLLAIAVLASLTGSGPIARWSADGRQVINGEPADSVGRILWVDDHPENNAAEKRFLEQRRVGVYQVTNSEDALTLLRMYAYGAVVSDMGHSGRPLAGIDLLKAMRARGDRRPFFLYTVHSSDAQRRLVADAGGQGVAERSGELYAAILPLFGQGDARKAQ